MSDFQEILEKSFSESTVRHLLQCELTPELLHNLFSDEFQENLCLLKQVYTEKLADVDKEIAQCRENILEKPLDELKPGSDDFKALQDLFNKRKELLKILS